MPSMIRDTRGRVLPVWAGQWRIAPTRLVSAVANTAANAPFGRAKQVLAVLRRNKLFRMLWGTVREIGVVGRAVTRLRRWSERPRCIDFETFMRRDALTRREAWPELLRHIEVMPVKPRFAIVIEGNDPVAIERTLVSLRQQPWPDWRPHVTPSAWPIPAEALTDTDYVVFLHAGDTLTEETLYEFAAALNATPDLDLVYADDDRLDATGAHRDPFFRPAWSPDTLESFNYLGRSGCYRAAVARSFAEADCLYDFVLRFTEAPRRIAHRPKILLHRTAAPADEARDIEALRARLLRTGRDGEVTPGSRAPGHYDIVSRRPSRDLVTIVMPTAGKRVRIGRRVLDLAPHCVGSILDRSSYRQLDIVLVDHGSLDGERRAVLERLGCRFVTYRGTEVNIAAKINLGAAHARGGIVAILNDDMEVIAPDWIERMLDHLEKPHVGVVGAKLVYPDRTLQHAGIVFNSGDPEHVRRTFPADDPGYFHSGVAARNYSAVTGACMMSRLEVFTRVAGYSEEFPTSYNDVDYCMKVADAGLTVVYEPRAELFHFDRNRGTR